MAPLENYWSVMMKKQVLLPVLMIASCAALAQDVGKVISSTPIIQQVAVPRQVCSTQQVAVQQQKSGAGAVMGALAGGAVGNAVGGRGAGNAAATMLGLVGGAILGDRIEGQPTAQIQNVQNCAVQNFYENHTVAYHVLYEFGGKQYAVQMPQDPGPTINLQVSPMGAMNADQNAAMAQAPVQYIQPVSVAPTVVYAQPYYAQPAYPPVSLDLGVGYWGGRRWR
jgi:uncharacterized protein YcfJ